METTPNTPVKTIDRSEVPAGSFRYGQEASRAFDVPAHLWAVCTECSTPLNPEDNGRSGFRTVLVAHFLHTSEDMAESTAANLTDCGPVWIVRPTHERLAGGWARVVDRLAPDRLTMGEAEALTAVPNPLDSHPVFAPLSQEARDTIQANAALARLVTLAQEAEEADAPYSSYDGSRDPGFEGGW